ncbi:MAG: hypothetical protein ABRQ34_04225 [Smithellaceae bacterium]
MEMYAGGDKKPPFSFVADDGPAKSSYSISKSMMIPWRLGGGDEAYYPYVEEADDPGLRRGRLCQQR